MATGVIETSPHNYARFAKYGVIEISRLVIGGHRCPCTYLCKGVSGIINLAEQATKPTFTLYQIIEPTDQLTAIIVRQRCTGS